MIRQKIGILSITDKTGMIRQKQTTVKSELYVHVIWLVHDLRMHEVRHGSAFFQT